MLLPAKTAAALFVAVCRAFKFKDHFVFGRSSGWGEHRGRRAKQSKRDGTGDARLVFGSRGF